ncbi:gfo/Idh/MocA family oxidoreductase [Cohnella fermenti]|uniref:Gfo/Idh/MocA family oxidoreductase n=2 Tax=Cohnella fermenti TaxID=2565925 RepID=A0A4S4C6K3_9BACL|nr:gfo/Idh/MocA family oxidoreductase [Cohnella fermenti]
MNAANSAVASEGSLRIGMVGLDNSRVVHFARMLNEEGHPYRIEGARLVAAWPGAASPDFAMSAGRLDGYVRELRDRQGVAMLESIDEVARRCDAWMLEAVDGRTRLELFGRMAPYGKPIFVDKPFALSSAEAEEMARLAAECGTPWMSCSALRYAGALTSALRDNGAGPVLGADFHGPMALEPTQPGYFWYGIHTAEMLFRALGQDCAEVTAFRTPEHDAVVGTWADGRIGTIRGFRTGSEAFGGTLHRASGSRAIEIRETDKPFLAETLEALVSFFRAGRSPVDPAETLAIVSFLEAANRSLADNCSIRLLGRR